MSVVISFNISCVSERLFPKCYAYLLFFGFGDIKQGGLFDI